MRFALTGYVARLPSLCAARCGLLTGASKRMCRNGSRAYCTLKGMTYFPAYSPAPSQGRFSRGFCCTAGYTKTHEFVRDIGETVTVCISSHALEQLGEVVFIDFPKCGQEVKQKESLLSLESVKAVAEIYSPCDGVITQVNESIQENEDNYDCINQDPEGKGWLVKIQQTGELETLMNVQQYTQFVNSAKVTH